MDRRIFLGAMAGTMAATMVDGRSAFAEGSHRLDRIGVQLYTVRDAMKTDFAGTLAQVAKIGYNEVEFAGYFDHTPKEVRAILDQNHLQAPSAHVDFALLGADWEKTLDAAHIVGHKILVCPWIPDEIRNAPGGWQQAADTLNHAGEISHKAGIQLAYHNHNFEFHEVNGKKPYDTLLAKTDAALVKMEIDLFWMILAGSDPVAYMEKNPGRVVCLHVKDMVRGYGKKEDEQSALDAAHMEKVMVDVGSGGINFGRIFEVARRTGVKHYFVEHDNPKVPLESLRNSWRYLNDLRF